ncbi:MAG: HD domain-containing protein [bacterium]
MKVFLGHKFSTTKQQPPAAKTQTMIFSNRLSVDSVCFTSISLKMQYTKKEQEAYNLAQKLFEGKYRKDNITPYFKHCEDVGNKLKESGYDEDTVSAGFLHDVVDDIKGWTTEKIEQLFGKKTATLVEEASHGDATTDWNVKLFNALEKLKKISTEGRALVASDKMSSIKDDIKAFKVEGDRVFDKLKSGPERQLFKHLLFHSEIMKKNPPNEPLRSDYNENINTYTQMAQSIISRAITRLVA